MKTNSHQIQQRMTLYVDVFVRGWRGAGISSVMWIIEGEEQQHKKHKSWENKRGEYHFNDGHFCCFWFGFGLMNFSLPSWILCGHKFDGRFMRMKGFFDEKKKKIEKKTFAEYWNFWKVWKRKRFFFENLNYSLNFKKFKLSVDQDKFFKTENFFKFWTFSMVLNLKKQ